jgi:P4 family phage/plasmid primase-like protien
MTTRRQAARARAEYLAAARGGEADDYLDERYQRRTDGKGQWNYASGETRGNSVVAEYYYLDEHCDFYLRVQRTADKQFPQAYWDGNGWKWGKPKGPKIPYMLPELIEAGPDEPVFICEGEKDADNVAKLGLVATCASEGAGKWTSDLNKWFANKETIYILEDNDDAGRRHAQQVARNLRGIANKVRIVALPGLPENGDVSDWLAARGTKEQLIEICAAAPLHEAKEGLVLDPLDPMPSARALVARNFTKDELRTLHRHRGAFWAWNGSCYQLVEDEVIEAAIWALLEKAKRPVEKGPPVPFKPTRAKVGDIAAALAAVCQLNSHVEPPAWLTQNSAPPAGEFFACGNGLLHLPTGRLYPPTSDYFNLSASEVSFDPDAPEPAQWFAFLKQLFGDDEEAIELLQDWFGYVLSPDTRQQKIFLIVGPRRSGKGTIARVLTRLLGRDSVGGPTMSSLSETFGLEPLITKPLAIVSDMRIGARTDKSTLVERLLSISGEDSLTVHRKFRQAWDSRLPTRFMIMTNELPSLSDGSAALAGRFVVLIMTVSFFGNEDQTLTNKLATELPGILNWAIDGYKRLNKRGYFVMPKVPMCILLAITNPYP